MRRRPPLLASLLLVSVTLTSASSDEDDGEHLKEGTVLLDGDYAAAMAEKVATRFSQLFYSSAHGADPKRYFEHYNRFKDGGAKLQTLGPQELRELLKDLDVGPYALRGEFAAALTQLVDSDLDGRVSEAELSAAIDVATCWLDGSETPLAKAQALGALIESAGRPPAGDALKSLMGELQSCKPLRTLWQAHRHRAVQAEDRLIDAIGLAQTTTTDACAAAILAPLHKACAQGCSGGVGAGALRRVLKQMGVEPPLLRFLVPIALLRALDTDAPSDRLSDTEIRRVTEPLCEPLYASMRRRHVSAVDAVEALLFNSAWDAAAFVSALEGAQASEHERAKGVLANGASSPSDAAAVAAAFLELAPEGAFVGDANRRSKNEL